MSGRAPLRFVILAAPRTGSNLLCSLLNAHPDILCHHGLFNPEGIHCARDRGCGAIAVDPAVRDSDPGAFLDGVWAGGGTARAIGFKMNRGENEQALDVLLRDRCVRKILLRRRNRVRTYVSEEIARRTGMWESYGAPAPAEIPSIHVAPAALVRHVDRNAAYYAEIESALIDSDQAWLATEYEALAEEGEMSRILAYLDVARPFSLAPACHKRGPADLAAVVRNLDELAAALRGTALIDDLHRRDAPDLRAPLFAP